MLPIHIGRKWKHHLKFFIKDWLELFIFFFSPFPWDVKEPVHLIGMFDGLLYLVIIYFILRNIKTLWKDPILKLILIILICYFFIFGVGVSNFGAGTRHRSKFVVELIILAAPFIPRFTFLKKIKFGGNFLVKLYILSENLMRIIHIITGLGDGGAENALFKICKYDNLNKHVVISLKKTK